eukprot:663231-Pyramimonas_sp.AAC.1
MGPPSSAGARGHAWSRPADRSGCRLAPPPVPENSAATAQGRALHVFAQEPRRRHGPSAPPDTCIALPWATRPHRRPHRRPHQTPRGTMEAHAKKHPARLQRALGSLGFEGLEAGKPAVPLPKKTTATSWGLRVSGAKEGRTRT